MLQEKTKAIVDLRRRRLLIGMGLATGAFAAGVWGVSIKQTPDYNNPAYESWRSVNQDSLSDTDYMILCAGLAPSPHNTQPWKFSATESGINVFAETERQLGRADRNFRQMQIALGCAIYNLQMTARYLGYQPQVAFVADTRFSADGLVATIELQKTSQGISDEEFATIFSRSTNRGQYDLTAAVPQALIDKATSDWQGVAIALHPRESLPGLHLQRSVRVGARNLVRGDGHFEDSVKWWRYTREELLAKRDGVSIHTSETPFFVKEGMEQFVDEEMWKGGYGRNGEISFVDRIAQATTMWGVITADDDTQASRLKAGMALEKVYLTATAYGMHIHPLIYPIENKESHARLAEALAIADHQQIMSVFRVGKGVPLEKTVRRELASIKA